MSSAVVPGDIGLAEAAAFGEPQERGRARLGIGLWTGLVILTVVVLATMVVKLAGVGHPDQIELTSTLAAPSGSHLFGTDALGRDVFLRTVYASGLDLQVGIITTIVPLVIGMVLGMVSGFFGAWVDALIMRVMDGLLAFPFIVLIIAFITIFGVGLTGVYVGLTVGSIPFFARLTRGEMLVLREQQFMQAAHTLGYSTNRIVFKHALPHLVRPNLVFVPSNILGNILTLAALSYLGLGAQPPTPEWGAIIAGGQPYLLTAWWIATLPGLFVVIVGIGLSLTGEGLAERLRVRTG
ncbi:MAG: ABC transporter permease [Solirubrobacteraceae bacterium]